MQAGEVRENQFSNNQGVCFFSKGSAAKTRLLRPREEFAQYGAHCSLTLLLRAAQPKQGCYAQQLTRQHSGMPGQ
jgi:hypothetical protein